MDLFLLGGALGLSVTLPPTCVLQERTVEEAGKQKKKTLSSLSISLGLSFGLFALSILESLDSSWLAVLDNRIVAATATDDGSSRDDNEYLSLSSAYFVVLSLMAAYVLVICPSMAGVMVLDRLFYLPSGNVLCWLPKDKPWWLKLFIGTFSLIYKALLMLLSILYFMMQKCLRLCFKRRTTTMPTRDSFSTLPLTINSNNGSSSNGASSSSNNDTEPVIQRRVSVHCLMSSFLELLFVRGGICLVGSLLGVAVTLITLAGLAPFIIEPKSGENWLAVGVCWMTSLGILLSQFVNGFGSVSMPHSCLAGLYLDPIRPETVQKAVVDLEKTRESLQARKQKVKQMAWKQVSPTSSISPTNVSNTTKTSRWRTAARTFSSMGEEVAQQKKKLLEEIAFLETLLEEMTEDVEDIKYTQKMEAESRTTMGRVKSRLGVIFSVVLVARLYFAVIAIWRHWYSDIESGEQVKKDPVTTALLWMVGHHIITEKKYDEVSQFISLVLTAILSFSQIRTFLRTVAAIHRRVNSFFCLSSTSVKTTPRNDPCGSLQGADEPATLQTGSGVYVHILGALMGSYFLACIVMTKAMLPWQYRASFFGALGGLDAFAIQSGMITAMFAMSAVGSAIVLALLFGVQKSNGIRHNVSWMDDVAAPTRDLDV